MRSLRSSLTHYGKNTSRSPEIKHSIKKKLKRIDMGLIERLLMFLYYNNKIKKTNIAMKCGMSYDKCILYLDWMKEISLIKTETDEGFELISLSDRGKDFFEKNYKNT